MPGGNLPGWMRGPVWSAAIAALLWSGAPAHADTMSLNIMNRGNVTVSGVQISPDYSPRWGGNYLGAAIPPGQQGRVELNDGSGNCFYDVQIEDATGGVRQFWGLNLCARPTVEVR